MSIYVQGTSDGRTPEIDGGDERVGGAHLNMVGQGPVSHAPLVLTCAIRFGGCLHVHVFAHAQDGGLDSTHYFVDLEPRPTR